MASIQEKKQRRGAILGELKAIRDAAKALGRDVTAEETATITARLAECETLKHEIAHLEAAEQNLASIDALDAELAAPGPRRTQPDGTARLEPVDKPPFQFLGEQLQAIATAGLQGDNPGSRDQRLVWENLAPATGAAQASVPSDGGYLIQKDFSTELLGRMNETGQIKKRVRTINVQGDGLKLPVVNETSRATGSRWGGVQVYWGAENDAATAKKPAFRMMELQLNDLIGLAYVSNRLLQDASAVGSIFSQAFTEEMAFMCDDALVNGDGAGKPLGILNGPALVTVNKETGQPAATIQYENLVKMHARLWARSRPTAAWFINQDVEPQLNLLLHQGATGVIPPAFIQLGADGVIRILGKPVVVIEHCATLGTVGDIILADFEQVVAIEKGGMQADSSIHVRFTTNENTFRFIYRYDAQPLWNSALTPFKGSNTQSPFVVLQTRS